jgi:hypothetical protein
MGSIAESPRTAAAAIVKKKTAMPILLDGIEQDSRCDLENPARISIDMRSDSI